VIVLHAILWTSVVVGLGANLTLADRLDWLRRTGRAPEAPPLARYMFWSGQWWATSGDHRRIKDRMTTALVWIIRGALAVLAISALVNILARG
jgi:hypothetical protein